MQPPIRKATFIIRLWTADDPTNEAVWRGTAEHIGSGQPRQFEALDEFINWLHQELAEPDEKLVS